MEIINTSISQVILTRFDEIPLDKLVQSKHLEGFKNLFHFREANVGQNPEGAIIIIAEHGMYVRNGEEVPIRTIILEERRLQLIGVEAGSAIAYEIVESMKGFLAELAEVPLTGFLDPIVVAEDSELIARLDFPYSSLISPALMDFIEQDAVEATTLNIADADYKFAQLAFNVEYFVTDKKLSDYRISLSRKEFRLEPRKGYPLSDQVYYCKAPLATDNHIELITALENRLSKIRPAA
jgi:hypothetical protein